MKDWRLVLRKISLKGIAVHLIGLIVSMLIIWGVSYLILVTFSIQDSAVALPIEPIQPIKTASSTVKNKNGQGTSTHATTTATTTKSKK